MSSEEWTEDHKAGWFARAQHLLHLATVLYECPVDSVYQRFQTMVNIKTTLLSLQHYELKDPSILKEFIRIQFDPPPPYVVGRVADPAIWQEAENHVILEARKIYDQIRPVWPHVALLEEPEFRAFAEALTHYGELSHEVSDRKARATRPEFLN